MTRSNMNLIVLDLETTGLDSLNNVIIEIAALPVDQDLNLLDDGWTAVINPALPYSAGPGGDFADPAWVLAQHMAGMHDTVLKMHAENGLFDDIDAGKGISLSAATTQFLRYAEQFAPHGQTPLPGSSVHFDRKFLERYAPGIDRFYHYRLADVSSVKEYWKRWFPEAGEPPKVKAHRALADCYETVKEARWYKDRLRIAPSFAAPKEVTDDERRILREVDEQMRTASLRG